MIHSKYKIFHQLNKIESHRQNYEKYEDGMTINTEYVVDESALRTFKFLINNGDFTPNIYFVVQ
jgi:hypothetical protein